MENRPEFLRLLSSLCDGQLSEVEQARLQELLSDDEARRLYLQYLDMHAHLLTHATLGVASKAAGVDAIASVLSETAAYATPLQPAPGGARRLSRLRIGRVVSYVAVAVATVAATVLVQLARNQPLSPHAAPVRPVAAVAYVATLSQASNAEWGPATPSYQPGSRVLSGEFELRSGVARLAYEGGIELVVEAPARLELESGAAATLLAGKVVFRADDAATPFTLSTPTSILVDRGTEYAVEVRFEQELVYVFSGEVERVPKDGGQPVKIELLAAGEARRYHDSALEPGEATTIDPQKFVRQLPALPVEATDAAAGLLAYEGFAYADENALRGETANGGSGFAGPWSGGFARAPGEKLDDRFALNLRESLVRQGNASASGGGSFDHIGFAKYFRRLKTPLRLDSDGMYYVSFLLRREGPPLDPLNDVSIQFRQSEELERDQQGATIDLRKRLNFGVDRTNELFTHLERIGRRMPLPLSYGETYLLAAKVAASGAYPDQVFLRMYGPQEPVDASEPATWSAVGPPIQSDLVFDWLEIHINSHTRQTIDEIRVGTTWSAVVAPWMQPKVNDQ